MKLWWLYDFVRASPKRSAVVSTYQKWSKKGKAVNGSTGSLGGQGSLMHIGQGRVIQQTSYCRSYCWKSGCWFWCLNIQCTYSPCLDRSGLFHWQKRDQTMNDQKLSPHQVEMPSHNQTLTLLLLPCTNIVGIKWVWKIDSKDTAGRGCGVEQPFLWKSVNSERYQRTAEKKKIKIQGKQAKGCRWHCRQCDKG